MKKLIAIIVGVLFLGGVIFISYQQLEKDRVSIEEVLPPHPLVFMRTENIDEQLRAFQASSFWKAVEGIDVGALVTQGILSEAQGQRVTQVKGVFEAMTDSNVFEGLLGKEVVVAVYPPNLSELTIEKLLSRQEPMALIGDLLNNFILVTRITPEFQISEKILKWKGASQSSEALVTEEYRKHVIYKVALDAGIEMGLTRLEDVLIVGLGLQSAQQGIDRWLDRANKVSLAQDDDFQARQQEIVSDDETFLYVNVQGFLNFVEENIPIWTKITNQEEALTQKVLQDNLKQTHGFLSATYAINWDKLTHIQWELFFDLTQMIAMQKDFFESCQNRGNRTLKLVPEKALGYYWNGCLNLDYYWQLVQDELEKGEGSVGQKIVALEDRMGLEIEMDVLPAFGREIGGYVKEINMAGAFPIPQFVTFIGVEQKDKMQSLLDQLLDQPFFMMQQEVYKEVALQYIFTPLGEILEPVYCFIDDYLLIALNRPLLKEAIDVYQGDATALVSSPLFKRLDQGLTDKNSSLQFVRSAALIDEMKKALGWGRQWNDARVKQARAFQAGRVRRLEDVQIEKRKKESELQELKSQLEALKDKIQNSEEASQVGQQEEKDLKASIEKKIQELVQVQDQEANLQDLINKERKNAFGDKQEVLYDQVIDPLMDGIKSMEAYGMRSQKEASSLKSDVFILFK